MVFDPVETDNLLELRTEDDDYRERDENLLLREPEELEIRVEDLEDLVVDESLESEEGYIPQQNVRPAVEDGEQLDRVPDQKDEIPNALLVRGDDRLEDAESNPVPGQSLQEN